MIANCTKHVSASMDARADSLQAITLRQSRDCSASRSKGITVSWRPTCARMSDTPKRLVESCAGSGHGSATRHTTCKCGLHHTQTCYCVRTTL